MDKNVLSQYMDAETLIEHTERQLKRLKAEKEAVLSDTVTGSNPQYPYQPVTFKIEGKSPYAFSDVEIKRLEIILKQRRRDAADLRLKVEAWINTLPPRIQLIIQIKYLAHGTWDDVARKVGHNTTPDGLRMEFQRYMAGVKNSDNL